MKKSKLLISIFAILLCLYIIASWLLLNGKLIYTTSFNESTIEASKKENLFVSNDLKILSEGDSLVNWGNIFEVWTNKRYEIKYFGILFHWTYTKSEWRYLNIGFKDELYPFSNDWCTKDNIGNGFTGCCDRIDCNVGDTVKINFYKCKDELRLGALKIIVK